MKHCPEPEVLTALGEGVLPEEFAAGVRSHLETCALCRQLQADLAALAEPTLGEAERLRARVLGRRTPRWRVAMIGSLAAAIAVAFALWRPETAEAPKATAPPVAVSRPAAAPVYRVKVEPAPLRLPFATALILRGEENRTPEAYLRELGRALEPYRAGKYAEAVEALRELAERHPKAVEPPFYEGVAALLAGDAPEAVRALERSRAIGGEALNDEIPWYLAAAYERAGQAARSVELLRAICRAEGIHREAACAASR